MKLLHLQSSSSRWATPGPLVEAALLASLTPQAPPELLSNNARMSLEDAIQAGYAIVEASREERRTLFAANAKLPTLLAYFIAFYKEVEGADDHLLARKLGCTSEQLEQLGYRLEPREAPQFRTDMEHICRETGCSLQILIKVFRHAQVLDALRSTPPHQQALVHLHYRDGGGEWGVVSTT